jgi:hypothetical protein
MIWMTLLGYAVSAAKAAVANTLSSVSTIAMISGFIASI